MRKIIRTIKILKMKYFQILVLLFLVSCGNKKMVQLPEIDHSEFTEILDVSPAYIFYDETKKDSIELNRKSLIVTTNWLVNVDKRLTLNQAIPKIVYLQNKKRNAEVHKNEDAKNFYTCHNTSINNLGFIEFTDIYYLEKQPNDFNLKPSDYSIIIQTTANMEIRSAEETILKSSETTLLQDLNKVISENTESITFHLFFSEKLSFQDYISFKSLLNKLTDKKNLIANKEFIFN